MVSSPVFGLASEIQTGVLLSAFGAPCAARLVSLQVRDQICNNTYAIGDFQGNTGKVIALCSCAEQTWDKDVDTYPGGLSPRPQAPRTSVWV